MHDLIERQAVKEWLAKWEGYIDADIIARMQYRIIDMPSVQPEPCEDTVSRKAAIDAINELHDKPNAWLDMAVDALEKLPSAQAEQRWIPVDLRNNSPEENKVVLLGVRFQDDFKYFVTSRQDYNYWTGLGRKIIGELRWQPLPEKYMAERRTDEQDD